MAPAARKLILMGALLLVGCFNPPPKKDNRAYNLTTAEVSFFAGCLDMGNKMQIKDAVTICADLNVAFLKRQRREWE